MAIFRLGLVGAGRMGRTHLRALAASESVAIVAVTEPAPSVRDELAQTGLAVHGELDAMLDAGGIDGVMVAAPSNNHLALVRRVAAFGLPILCEKPCGTTAAQAAEAARITHALRLQAESFARGADGTETDAAHAEDDVAALTAAETASQVLR